MQVVFGVTFMVSVLLTYGQSLNGLPAMPPYFFLCNYHGNVQELGRGSGEVKLSVSIEGNPDTYVPGNLYQVSVRSSSNFDGFFVTGLFTISEGALSQLQSLGIQGNQPVGKNLACSIVHSHTSREPVHEFNFHWIAPPQGTGCVSFLATATLERQLLFKDTTVLQLCEHGGPTLAPLRPAQAVLHSDGIIFRDDFDSHESFSPNLWSTHDGGVVGRSCGSIFYGDAVVMCEKTGRRALITQPLNTTTAAVLQFTIGLGSCRNSSSDQDITVSFGLKNCQEWHVIESFRPPSGDREKPDIRLVHLPPKARGEGICFAWKQAETVINPIPKVIPGLGKPTGELTFNLPGQIDEETTSTNTPVYVYQTTVTKKPVLKTTTHEHVATTSYDVTTESVPDTTEGYDPYDDPLYTPPPDFDFGELSLNDEPVSSNLGKKFGTKTQSTKKKLVYKVGGKTVGGEGQQEQRTVPYQGCWAIDQILIVNMAHPPRMLQDDFDPVDPSDWLVFPGAHFKHQCHSDKTAIVFNHESLITEVGSRDLNLNAYKVADDVILQEEFESKKQPGWTVTGGRVDITCGIIGVDNSMVFDGADKRRKICSPLIDLRKSGNLRFKFGYGSGGCNSSDLAKAHVMVYLQDESEQTLKILEKLSVKSYREPELVSIPLPPSDKYTKAKICWLQKYTGGQGQNAWAIDNVQVLPHLPEKEAGNKDKMAQFNMNLKCGSYPENNHVELQYSTNLGETWYKLHQPCLPGQCTGYHFPVNTDYEGTDFDTWKRVTLPLPYVTLVPHVRFRWQKTSDDDPNWALDEIYIGDCPKGCNSHGTCKGGTCQCDFGYTGETCRDSVIPNPTIMMENFEGTSLPVSSTIDHIYGASLGYQCDVLSTGKAVVFYKDGRREFVTGELNTTNNQYLQFNIRVGSYSPVSDCPAPDETKELVILDYTCDGGVHWHLLKTFNIHDYRKPKSDSVMLPEAAQDIGCKFRWWQPVHSGPGRDVWALDDLSLNDHMFNTLHLHMSNLLEVGSDLKVAHGELSDNYCRRMKSISFIGGPSKDDARLLTTNSMHVGPGYIMQFELVMGCGLPYDDLDNKIFLEYSTDHGIHWNLVVDPCLPPEKCEEIHQGTVYDWTQYRDWKRVTVPLPSTTWGPSSRFRFRQNQWSSTDTWGIARLYIGQQCPNYCHGHGECMEGRCKCDEGFEGESCEPATHLDDQMQADFGMRYEPDTDFLHYLGGKVVSNNRGCGNIHSDESLYFYDDGMRELVSKDMDTRKADYLQFNLKIGGSEKDCNGAEKRAEGVILQYSNDGGITWHLLEELVNSEYRLARLVSKDLPEEAKTPNTRFRWWQPQHDGKGHDHWAVDEIRLGKYENLHKLEDNFDRSVDPLDSKHWLSAAGAVIGKYCNSRNPVLILGNQETGKSVVTKDLKLNPGDVIQFRINVGCSNQFRWNHPVMLQYWPRGGYGFQLVQESCYQEMECEGNHGEGSVYHTGTHGHWELVVIPVTEELAKHPMYLRWWQPGGYPYNFALDDVYIGPPCAHHCHRNGVCEEESCHCDGNMEDINCQSDDPTPYGVVDRFEQYHRPSHFWKRIWGGHLGIGCGTVDSGNALFFDGEGTREAVTVPLNTKHLRMLEFLIQIGSTGIKYRCTQPSSPNEGIIVDYSTDNEITWHPLKLIEPILYNGTRERVVVELPGEAKTERTIFRWWQPLGYGGMKRAEWGLDSVTIGVNETNLDGFQDDFTGMMPDMFTWFQTQSAVPRIACNSRGNALEFSRNGGTRYAETWDYHVTPSTFLQFDIAMGCDSLYDTLYGVMLEYSNDMGKHWSPVVQKCAPPDFECGGYHLESDYMSDQHQNWTRISLYLPPGAVSPATRFRWKQHSKTPSSNVWALDNVYLGDGCPWLCSGHGYCDKGTCVCDDGFEGEYCVPSSPLPMMLRDDFNREKPKNDNWLEIYGATLSSLCDKLVSENALTFSDDHLRMAVTRDLDTTMLNTIEFYFKYGCNGKELEWPRRESVLLQYSNNGGITWNLVKELHYRNETGPRFFSLELPVRARHNSTRFRFWQPANGGKMRSTWAVDNLFIGRMTMNPHSMKDDFDSGTQSDSWLFVNDGKIGTFCERNIRNDSQGAGLSAVVFRNGLETGEHSIVTRDLDVGPMSILQFDINVGCASLATHKYPVQLQYSADGGKTWQLVVPNCAEVSTAVCYDSVLPASIYYGGTSKYWRRVVIPLDNFHVCGSLRFRWYQGFIPEDDFGPEWAIDNVFIGMACMEHCRGQGDCGETMMCQCDPGYQGDVCVPSNQKPIYMKEDFPLADGVDVDPEVLPFLDSFISPGQLLDERKWDTWGGGQVSMECGLLVDGNSLVFHNTGDRVLSTKELNLTKATTLQFYLRLGCKDISPDPATPPVYTQYTTNGGITWHTIEQNDFNKKSREPFYVVLNLPAKARSHATKMRWWQPSKDGEFMEDWAIDQIYIGGDYDGVPMMADDPGAPRDPSWTLNPGGVIEEACYSDFKTINMKGTELHRFAVTADVEVTEGTLLQFNIAMGCSEPEDCFSVQLGYSLDKGVTWKPVWEPCLPSNVDCNKYFHPGSDFRSDVVWGWNRINAPLPFHTRSKSTRFMWYQKEGFEDKDTWAVANLYIGKDCPRWCSGHGRCTREGCICDVGWNGDHCDFATQKLPTYLYDMFTDETNSWKKVAGGKRTDTCQKLASGLALHFTGNCSRVLTSQPLDLSNAAFVQFYFMYGCHSTPDKIDESVLMAYSPDGIVWINMGILHYMNYRSPTFVTMKLPEGARRNGTQIGFTQLEHSGLNEDDWLIDNLRVGGRQINPDIMQSDFPHGIDPEEWNTFDNIKTGEYCEAEDVAIGSAISGTDSDESATLTTQDLAIRKGHMIQFWYNVGCMREWNKTVAPVHLQYSTDYGMTWNNVVPQCLPNNPACPYKASMASLYYGDPMGRWQRVTLPLNGMTLSNSTRFRWQQRPVSDNEAITEFALRDVYIGPACEGLCGGHGDCHLTDGASCHCDPGYQGDNCYPWNTRNLKELKDVFTELDIEKSKWFRVQGGSVQEPCINLVEGTALVFNGPGIRQLVTTDLDLRDARFVQYTATVGGEGQSPGCYKPYDHGHSVILQYSNDGGIHWDTLHTLDYTSYYYPRRDYIKLPQDARTPSTRIRWWQPLSDDPNHVPPTWAIDDIYIGGKEINPAQFEIDFNETRVLNDQPWEFNPFGRIETEVCKKDDSVIYWDEGKGQRHFTTKQMIVQSDYILQFKIAVGCSKAVNACIPHTPIILQFNKNPGVEEWHEVVPLCLPDVNQRMDCLPNSFHYASVYTADAYPSWTRITIPLTEKTFSSNTRFRWIQNSTEGTAPGWALDDIYVGEKCPKMCHGRGDCKGGRCHCDDGYKGRSCVPIKDLPIRMFDSFEGGIFTSNWEWVSGRGIGFGCGALLPYAHGKTLYFNGCGLRQALTVEMDLEKASKIMFVLQIGCRAQTPDCNVKTDDVSDYRGILLQYSNNRGTDWKLIARHDPGDYLTPSRVSYDIPKAARTLGVQFRWWQPGHGGEGSDQWAIDNLEIIRGRSNIKYYRRRRHNQVGEK